MTAHHTNPINHAELALSQIASGVAIIAKTGLNPDQNARLGRLVRQLQGITPMKESVG